LITASSSDSSSNVTRSWQNDRETTSSTSDWTSTTAADAHNSTSFEDINATAVMLTTSAPSYISFWQYEASLRWFEIGSPILIVLATVGNTVALITLQNPLFHRSSTSFILSALAFADLSVVDIRLLHLWIQVRFDTDFRSMTSFGCKLHVLLAYYSHHVRCILINLLSHARYTKPTHYLHTVY